LPEQKKVLYFSDSATKYKKRKNRQLSCTKILFSLLKDISLKKAMGKNQQMEWWGEGWQWKGLAARTSLQQVPNNQI
jgi:hypothetical protein